MLNVLLSAYNETDNPFFWKTLATIKSLQLQGLKIKLVVGLTPGRDNTQAQLDENRISYVEVLSTKRSERYNKAFELVAGGKDEWVLLNHPRSHLERNAFLSLRDLSRENGWGAFTHQFDVDHPLLSFTSWWSNYVRGDIKNIYYLDHCLFVRRDVFEKVGGFPDREIFEDTILSKKLASLYRPIRLPWKSTTSSIRFKTNGIWNQAIQNQILKCRFVLNDNDVKMNWDYERGIDLNSEGRK